MRNPSAADPSQKSSVRDKIVCILFGVLLTLVVLELFLRLLGFGYKLTHKVPVDAGADYRIFCVGESTTCGIGSSNDALYNYPHQLETILNKKFPGLHTQCFFDLDIGINTTENLIKLPAYIKRYRPNLVIFMVGMNNWWNLNKSNVLIFNKGGCFSHFFMKGLAFLDHFRVYKLFKWIAYSFGAIRVRDLEQPYEHDVTSENRKRKLNEMEELRKQVENKVNPDIFNMVAFYDLVEMVRICKSQKISALICSYPKSREGIALAQKKAALLTHCPFVDNRTIFKNLPNENDYFTYDALHPNDRGYRLLAGNIFAAIIENNFIAVEKSS